MVPKNGMSNTDIVFSPGFFEDEVRNGFLIPTMTKRYWAASLKVLSEIRRICSKYRIQWYAMLGTLLGAVRHNGYIPWDDDMDICMLRKDYDRFISVAEDELPEGYKILDIRITPEFDDHPSRIVNHSVIDYGEDHLKEFCGCPYVAGVDIFVLDDVYDDSAAEDERMQRLADIHQGLIELSNCMTEKDALRKRELLLLAEDTYSEYSSDVASQVAVMPAFASYRVGLYPKSIFEKTVNLQFENIFIPVPEEYDRLLTIMYGNYMVVKKGTAAHNYPQYEETEKMLADRLGCNPYRYTYSKDDFEKKMEYRAHTQTTDEICKDMLDTLSEAIAFISKVDPNDDITGALKIMENCQELAIALGTAIEKRIPESREAVSRLEELCELLYEAHESPGSENIDALTSTFEEYRVEIEAFLKTRKRKTLFLPCTARWWDSMREYYEKCIEDDRSVVSVVSIPYYEMHYDGSNELISNAGEFPKDINPIPIKEYDFEHFYADEIVIQIPYDETSTVIRVPKFFYADNLLNHTDRLTYIPHLSPDAPAEGDEISVKTLKIMIEQPAVIYSDKIILGSEAMKRVYVDRLTELAGEETREYWSSKIGFLENNKVHDIWEV